MIIVSGWLRVAADGRQQYLDGCRAVIESARAADGCLAFHIAGDLLDPERVNVFEKWDSAEAVERFRGSGMSDDQQAAIIEAHVEQHEVESTTSLT